MAQCQWCDKSLPGDTIPACGSCISRPISQAAGFGLTQEEGDEDSDKSLNYDLSHLDEPPKKDPTKGRSLYEVTSDLLEASRKQELTVTKEVSMKRVVVKSNSIRGQSFVIDNIVLKFDENGEATTPENNIPAIKRYAQFRPNRIWVVEEEAKEEKVQEAKSEEPPALVEVAPVVDPVPAAPKKAVKKATKKRVTKKKTKPTKKRATKKATTKKVSE